MWICENLNHQRSVLDKRVLTWRGILPDNYIFCFDLRDDSWVTEYPDNHENLIVQFECLNEIKVLKDNLSKLLEEY